MDHREITISNIVKKIAKLFSIVATRDPLFFKALRRGVAVGIEHTAVLRMIACSTVVDIGANRGQFALAARHCFPGAAIFSFEPLTEPAVTFRRIFAMDDSVTLHNVAIGPETDQRAMHVSRHDDSSSLLPISSLQEDIYPGTSEATIVDVRVVPLGAILTNSDIGHPAMLKLDVQGFELDALQGCESLLSRFEWVYCECSFVELYTGQKLAADVIGWLSGKGFQVNGVYNPFYDREGRAIQADFLFQRVDIPDKPQQV